MNGIIAKKLLDWFNIYGEDYPFRRTGDPYRLLVCEILLRKTTAKQVSRVYDEFFVKFSTIDSLASASIEEIIRVIKPLGIWNRAYDLNEIAKSIVKDNKGNIPNDMAILTSMKGIGRYIANCVLACSYGENVPMVDSNVERVLGRILGITITSNGSPKKQILEAYSRLAPNKDVCKFHYAMIDLSHKICKIKHQECEVCPIFQYCKCANAKGRMESLYISNSKAKRLLLTEEIQFPSTATNFDDVNPNAS